jgi:hypothetical protein
MTPWTPSPQAWTTPYGPQPPPAASTGSAPEGKFKPEMGKE